MGDNPDSDFGFLKKKKCRSKFYIQHKGIVNVLKTRLAAKRGPLHPYQMEAVLKTRELLLRDKMARKPLEPAVIVGPTGCGKSGIIVLLPYVLASQRVLVLTPSKIISEQLAEAFGQRGKKYFFEEINLVTDPQQVEQLKELGKVITGPGDLLENLPNLVIVNAQKFGGRSRMSLVYENKAIIEDVKAFFRNFDTLIVDEAHHYPARTWMEIVRQFSEPVEGMEKKIVLVTATPYKMVKNKPEFILGKGRKDRIAYEISYKEVERVSTRPAKFLEMEHDGTRENLLRDINRHLKSQRRLESRFEAQVIVLVRGREEATELANYFNTNEGCPDFAVAVLGTSPSTILEDFSGGKYRVAVTCGVAKEGYNNTNITLCVIRRNIQSKLLFSQFVGRCMRLKMGLEGNTPDKTVATVLSYEHYNQRKLWENRNRLAEDDPEDKDSEEDETETESSSLEAELNSEPEAELDSEPGTELDSEPEASSDMEEQEEEEISEENSEDDQKFDMEPLRKVRRIGLRARPRKLVKYADPDSADEESE